MDEELYKQNILDRYHHPRHKKVPEVYDMREGGVNASCGDSLLVFLKFDDDGKIAEASFDGEGCAISQAATDMLLERIIGTRMEDFALISQEEIYSLLGITIGPSREKCALLAANTLRRWVGENPLGTI
ncbi:MAG: iron-sulfur cluster assembly scaffold protein [Parcubacteria group bacterium]|nr:iron-sulfur cluster assembly scaffold protein [Parcubacteria group bacterium]